MAKILNLDKLVKGSGRELTINGKQYKVIPMSVENFIETSRTVESLIKNDGSVADQIEATVDMVCRCVPDAPRDVLMKYELTVLNTIASFVRGDDVKEQEVLDSETPEAGK